MVTAPTAHVTRPGATRCLVRPGGARVGLPSFVPVVYPKGHSNQMVICGLDGDPLVDVAGAMDKPSWVLNGVGSHGVTLSAYADALDYLVDPSTVRDDSGRLRLVGRELQHWRDGVLIWQGPFVTANVSLSGTVKLGALDLGYYVTRKFMGAAERKDRLQGIGSMDRAGLPGWTQTGSCVKTRSTTIKARGIGSAQLTGNGAISASFIHEALHQGSDETLHLTAVVAVPSGTPVGTGLAGLTIRNYAGGPVVDESIVVVDEDTNIGGWTRIDTTARVPIGASRHVTVTLISLGSHGDTYFDDVRALHNDTTGIASPGADLSTHGVAIINHLQGGRGQGVGFKLRPMVVTNSGTVEVLGVRHLEHTQGSDLLQALVDRDDGIDWWIEPDGIRGPRAFCFAHRRGVDHDNLTFHDRVVTSGGWSHDESELSSKVVVIGDGDGVDRPEGGYWDTSRTAGLTLDYLHRPPNSTRLSALDPMARQVWAQKSQPQEVPGPLTIPDSWLPDIVPGDTFPTELAVGKVRTNARIRVATITLDDEAGQLVLT